MSVKMSMQVDQEAIRHFSESRMEPSWMTELRLGALEQVDQLELPLPMKTKLDKWNHLEMIPFQRWESIKGVAELPPTVQHLLGTGDQHQPILIQRDAAVVYTSIPKELQEQGIIFCSMEQALREHEELVKPYFMTEAIKTSDHRLTAIHGALWNEGAFLYVPKNVELQTPIQTVQWLSQNGGGLLPHILVVTEAYSRVTLLNSFVSNDEIQTGIYNGVMEIFVGSGSHVQVGNIQLGGEGITSYLYAKAIVERDGKVDWLEGDMNLGDTVRDEISYLKGDGSEAHSRAIAIGLGEQKANYTTHVYHVGRSTQSDILMKGVLLEKATVAFNGITKIEKGASKSNGTQKEDVLMLSKEAHGDANPILLIDEDDVMAGHAAAAGQVDQTQLYYLMTRGLTRTMAERLIVLGFLAPIIGDIPLKGVQELLSSMVERKIG
ncbi:Fe-S cluster assembly protein SufD [Rubeoparvulum massiliense]|uniref:Fe-S cluster assembly protein SufD n=1 Tax=Rubeoparvulum massiliense TaxID=1631346 RepID=UPI00065E48FF|nr:Fe-S cluster assembly protein SufD [Rubeoparvulum massiliense]